MCIQDLKPALNVQSDSLRAKIFIIDQRLKGRYILSSVSQQHYCDLKVSLYSFHDS